MKASDLEMRFRCTEDWSRMPGDVGRRHCAKCRTDVVNISAHSALSAPWVTLRGTPCVRFATRPDGRVRLRPNRLLRLGLLLGALLAPAARAGTLVVEVIDADALPIPGSEVKVRDASGGLVGSALTDDDGYAEIPVESGPVTVDVYHAGFAGVRATGVEPGTTRLVLTPREMERMTMGGITGRPLRRRLPAAWSAAQVELTTTLGAWRRVAVRCAGYASALHRPVTGTRVQIDGVPLATPCRARLTGGVARPLVVHFTAEEPVLQLEAAPVAPRPAKAR